MAEPVISHTGAPMPPTSYIVLSRGDHGTWTANVKPVQARSAEAAIRQVGAPGVYVAVPERSWKPTVVKAEQRTILTLEEAVS